MTYTGYDRDKIKIKAMLLHEEREELRQKFKEKGGFWSYLQYMDEAFFINEKFVLKELAGLLEEVRFGNIKKLLISFPPRGGKSYTVSQFCAYMLGIYKTGGIMRNSCTADLATKFSLDIQNIITDNNPMQKNKFKSIFGLELSTSKYGLDAWALKTSKEYAYFGTGIGGSILGKGCDIVAIIDDPIKNYLQAKSETILESHYQWYLSTHLSRLTEGTPEIIIATRWSEYDIIGMILKNEKEKLKSGEMVYVEYPLLNSAGKSFCEAIRSTKSCLAIKKQLIDAGFQDIFDAEYQQETGENKNKLFPLNKLKFTKPENVNMVGKRLAGYGDPADTGTDYFASMIAVEYLNGWFVKDIVYTQDPIEETSERISKQIYTNEPYKYVLETNKEGRSFLLLIKAILMPMLNENKKYYSPEMVSKHNSTNKETRILMNSGKILDRLYFRSDYKDFPEYVAFLNHLSKYKKGQKGQKDDGADMCAGFVAKFCTGQDIVMLSC